MGHLLLHTLQTPREHSSKKRFFYRSLYILLTAFAGTIIFSFSFVSPAWAAQLHASQSLKSAFSIGNTSYHAPSVVRGCGSLGRAITFTGTDGQINTDYIDSGRQDFWQEYTNFGPASACYQNDIWAAWTDTNGQVHVSVGGFLPLIPNETANDAPALTTCNGKLYLGWAGTDSSHHLNIMESPDSGSSARVVTFTDYTRSGGGISLSCINGQIYVAWVAATGTPYFYVGHYQPGSFNSQLQGSGRIGSDYASHAPSISPSDAGLTELEFIWKGYTNSSIYIGDYYITSSGNLWSGGSVPHTATTIANPSDDYAATAYTGTDNVIYFDYAYFFN